MASNSREDLEWPVGCKAARRAPLAWKEPSGQKAPSAEESVGRNKDVDFKKAQRNDWDANQAGGH